MLCQRCGHCCVAFGVVIQRRLPEKVEAVWKPHDAVCPHLSIDEQGEASCAVHGTSEYWGSPCHTYGNSELDIDFMFKRGKPCQVGARMRKDKRNVLVENRPNISELELCCNWEELALNN